MSAPTYPIAYRGYVVERTESYVPFRLQYGRDDGYGAIDPDHGIANAKTLDEAKREIDAYWLGVKACDQCGCHHCSTFNNCHGKHDCFTDDCPCVEECAHGRFLLSECPPCGRREASRQ